jgi:hypothetical protein
VGFPSFLTPTHEFLPVRELGCACLPSPCLFVPPNPAVLPQKEYSVEQQEMHARQLLQWKSQALQHKVLTAAGGAAPVAAAVPAAPPSLAGDGSAVTPAPPVEPAAPSAGPVPHSSPAPG